MKPWLIVIAIATLLLVAVLKRKTIVKVATEIVDKLSRSQFIDKYAPFAVQASRGTGLFPSLFIAQAILESNNGNSGLTRNAFNFFGIKADPSWKGDVYETKTREVIDGKEVFVPAKFRKYSEPVLSFVDRVLFLKKNKRYSDAGVFTADTPEAQAQALQTAKYATDPNYATLLSSIIKSNNLKRFDS